MAKSRKRAPARSKSRKTAPARKGGARKAAKKAAKKSPAKTPRRAPRTAAKRQASKKATRTTAKKAASKQTARKRAAPKPEPRGTATRRPPSLDRERRTIREDELIPSPPSSLNMDRSASSARSGRRELAERLREHTSTGPALTGGDVDADWEDAEAVGDEAPGGDNPTPDQDIVEEIGEAIGVTYHDNEELKGGDEIVERDRHRWELDPASREDYNDDE
jgi:hypothetical protein